MVIGDIHDKYLSRETEVPLLKPRAASSSCPIPVLARVGFSARDSCFLAEPDIHFAVSGASTVTED